MRILNEVTSVSVPEVISTHAPRPGTLGRFKVICADYKNATANGRLYPETLWESVCCEGSVLNTRLKELRAIGELDHPSDRIESKLTCAAVNLVEFNKNIDACTYDGIFDILDTPSGKIVKTLTDYGSAIGVSSRGSGELIEANTQFETVDPNTYLWEAFDVVLDPAVTSSKAVVCESKEHVVKDGEVFDYSELVENTSDYYELGVLKSVISSTTMPDKDSLLESINIKQSQILREGDNILARLTEDLEKATNIITDRDKTILELNKKVTTGNTRVSNLEGKSMTLSKINTRMSRKSKGSDEAIGALNEAIGLYKGNEQKYLSSIKKQELEIGKLKHKALLDKKHSENIIKESRELQSRLEDKCQQITSTLNSKIVESKKMASELDAINGNVMALTKKLDESKKNAANLENSLIESINEYARYVSKNSGFSMVEIKSACKGRTIFDINEAIGILEAKKMRLSALPFTIGNGAVKKNVDQISITDSGDRCYSIAKALSNKAD